MYMDGASQVTLVVKNPPANAGDARDVDSIPESGRSLGIESDNHSSMLAQKIPGTEEPGGYSLQDHKKEDTTE